MLQFFLQFFEDFLLDCSRQTDHGTDSKIFAGTDGKIFAFGGIGEYYYYVMVLSSIFVILLLYYGIIEYFCHPREDREPRKFIHANGSKSFDAFNKFIDYRMNILKASSSVINTLEASKLLPPLT